METQMNLLRNTQIMFFEMLYKYRGVCLTASPVGQTCFPNPKTILHLGVGQSKDMHLYKHKNHTGVDDFFR